MTRKHYVAFAEMFRAELELARKLPGEGFVNEHVCYSVRDLIRQAADIFLQDNPRFDRTKFYAACGLDQSGAIATV